MYSRYDNNLLLYKLTNSAVAKQRPLRIIAGIVCNEILFLTGTPCNKKSWNISCLDLFSISSKYLFLLSKNEPKLIILEEV